MASEIIKAILAAEEECKQKETEARKKAEAKKRQAGIDADNLVADAKKQVDKMIDDDKSAITKSADQRLEKQKVKFNTEFDALSKKAEKNIDRVTDMVIKAITC